MIQWYYEKKTNIKLVSNKNEVFQNRKLLRLEKYTFALQNKRIVMMRTLKFLFLTISNISQKKGFVINYLQFFVSDALNWCGLLRWQ